MRLDRYYLLRYLSRITEISFLDLIFSFSKPQTYTSLILEAVTYENTRRTHAKGDRCFILFESIYYIFSPYDFVTKCFLIFIVDEVKNFIANNFIQVARISHILGSVQRVSHKLKICVSRERRLLQDQVQLDIEAKVQLQIGILRQARIVVKFLIFAIA